MEKTFNIVVIILFFIILIGSSFFIGYNRGKNKSVDKIDTEVKEPDTSYNKVILDSIKWNILVKDSTIYKLNIKLKEDVEKSYSLDDSSAVRLLQELVAR